MKELKLDDVVSEFQSSHWQCVDQFQGNKATQLRGLPGYGTDQDYDYSEIVYFHSYVRDFLYGRNDTDADKRPMRVFRREDIHALRIQLDVERKYELSVNRVEGYLYETGVFLVVVEVEQSDQSNQLKLKDVLDLQNVVRMAFPRRWNNEGEPSEAPLRACWLNANGDEIPDSVQDFRNKEDFTKIVRERAELPASKHWKFLVQPFVLYGEHQEGDIAIRQIEDQRIPSMTYLGVPDPRAISEWDYARIAFFDDAGESSVGSYSDEFLANWSKTYTYDRFWQRNPSAGGTEVDKHNEMMRTRWLCCGYGFSVVGASNDPFFTGQLAANFRHHYFRMGLIAHFHRATILMFRDQLAAATKLKGEEFRKRVMTIQQEMTGFRARFWFREVSTQLQGQEIFTWWSDRLGNQSLFDQVTADIAAAETQVRTEFEAAEARGIKLITEIGGAIGIVSVLLSAAALMVSLPPDRWDAVVVERMRSGFIIYDSLFISAIVILLALLTRVLRCVLKFQRFN